MAATWKHENGEWFAQVTGGDFPQYMTGTPISVLARSGRKTRVLLGEHVRGWMIARGRHVDLYRVAEHDPR